MKEILHIDNLSIGYKGKPIVEHVSVELEPGQLVALLGRNGSGKTTFFKSITGDIPLIDGRITINGQNLLELVPGQRAQHIAVVYTGRPHLAGLEVFDIVSMGRHPYAGRFGKLSQNDLEIINRAIAYMGIEHLLKRDMDEISDGEFQKVLIARAIAQDTPVVLMDEPASFLDYPSKLELMDLLSTMCHDLNKLVVFSSHEVPLIRDKVDAVLGIQSGRFNAYRGSKQEIDLGIQEILAI